MARGVRTEVRYYIMMKEIEDALRRIIGGKAPGVDEVSTKVMKAAEVCVYSGCTDVHDRSIWIKKVIPGNNNPHI